MDQDNGTIKKDNLDSRQVADLLRYAADSKGDAGLWLHYLRKFVDRDGIKISRTVFDEVIGSGRLSILQQVIFKRAMTCGSPTQEYLISLNELVPRP